jgi:hypothetical protein
MPGVAILIVSQGVNKGVNASAPDPGSAYMPLCAGIPAAKKIDDPDAS